VSLQRGQEEDAVEVCRAGRVVQVELGEELRGK
jgi:hypothetical protein